MANQAAGEPKVGESAPLLQANKLLQATPGAKLDAATLKGNVVVLEFWATWCGPCVMAIPHFNEIAEKFKDLPVRFISITDEEEATVESFLSKKPIKGWIALDSDKAMLRAYNVSSIPLTVVLNKDHTIASMGNPNHVTEQLINDVLANKTNAYRAAEPASRIVAEPSSFGTNEIKPLFQVVIRPSAFTNNPGFSGGGGMLHYRGYTVEEMLPPLYEAPSSVRIITNSVLPDGRFDFIVTLPRGAKPKQAHDLLRQAAELTFSLKCKEKTNEMDAFVLKVKDTNAPGLVSAHVKVGGYHHGFGIFEGANVSMRRLAMTLEKDLNKPVLDETGLTNGYDISLKWPRTTMPENNPEGFVKAVADNLGLELVPARRPVEVMQVDSSNEKK